MLIVSVHEEYILERTKDVCKGGVDVAIDFVSSARTINRLTKVLKQVTSYTLSSGHFAKKATIHQRTTMLSTSKIVLY